tara:strand:- start:72 stop:1628 length:1557 start_codon:yes stop_codon:yes gene_type:complete
LAKKYILLSIFSGLLFGLSWPVKGLVFLIFIAFVPLLLIEKELRDKSSLYIFFYSLLSFVIWNLITSWWLINSTVFGMLFAIGLYSFLMALFFTSYSLISKKLGHKLGVIFFISSWIVFEKFNLSWEFSWPSLILGNVFSESHKLVQWFEFTGTLGGSLWILIVNIIFYKAFNKYLIKKYYLNKLSIGLLFVSFPIIISLYMYNLDTKKGNELDIAIVQPNIDPYTSKYGRTNLEILQEFKKNTEDNIFNNKLIITPETYFSESPGYQINNFFNTPFYKNLDNYLNEKNSEIISGIQFYKIYTSAREKSISSNYVRDSIWVDIYNSSFINSNTDQIYHKSKLVVGVENLPYKAILEPILGNLLIDFGGTVMSRATQQNRAVFKTKSNVLVAPVICYESMYGEFMTEYVRNGAQLIAIITNDGWWGNSPGHRQLLSYSKLRSIELRRYIVRSANTGISAVINDKGDVIESIDYEKKGIINNTVFISNELTFYAKYGDFIYRISLFFFSIIFLFYFAKKK